MNKQQLNEIEKITNVLSNELLSQNYDEANQMKFDKSLIINLLNLLNEVKEEQDYAIRWVPSSIGYRFNPEKGDEIEAHEFFTIINDEKYSYNLSNSDVLVGGADELLQDVSAFLTKWSIVEEFKKDMAQNVKIARHNAQLSQRTSL